MNNKMYLQDDDDANQPPVQTTTHRYVPIFSDEHSNARTNDTIWWSGAAAKFSSSVAFAELQFSFAE